MEKAKQEAFDNARLHVIKDGYERAFECINKGLTEDERGRKERALDLYRQGRQHLLRAISVPSQGEECVGPAWDSARQMQRKMEETLNNITTRLAVLETSVDSRTVTGNGALSGGAAQQLYPQLPSKATPGRPPSPNVRFPGGQPAGVVGGVTSAGHGLPGERPPAYSPQAADGHLSISYGTDSGEFSLVGDEFYAQASSMASAPQGLGEDGEELLFLPRGVQIFFVSPDGQVSAPSYPGYLRIVKFSNERSERAPNRPPAFLQVCDWLYPLMSRDSPALLCNTGVFMFPDMMAPVPGSYVGVVLSSELPLSSRELFQDLLSQLTDLKVQISGVFETLRDVIKKAPGEPGDTMNLSQKVPVAPPVPEEGPAEEEKSIPEWSEKVAHGILTGASWLSWGLVKGAEYTGKAIHKGASKLREHITPEDKPAAVSPTVSKGLHVAKQATGSAVKVSQFLVDGVCVVAGCVGRELAPHVKKHGLKLIPESLKRDKDGKSTVDGALVVAASGVQAMRDGCLLDINGDTLEDMLNCMFTHKHVHFLCHKPGLPGFATMWTGLEEAAKNIARSVASETVTTVKYKYGPEAGHATDNAVNSAINVGVTAFNVDNLGIKAVVKRTGKQTAQAILEDYKVQEKPDPSLEKKE